MFISREFKFDAAHFLPSYKGKCERLHGHTYKLRVKLEGEPDSEGMIVDFAEIKRVVSEKAPSSCSQTHFAIFSAEGFDKTLFKSA